MKTFTSMVTGVLIWIWTSSMGVEFAVLWGLIGFILNYIPFVGSIIAAIPACILTLITGGGRYKCDTDCWLYYYKFGC